MWNNFDKCIMRTDRAKSSRAQSKEVSAPIVIPCKVPESGSDRETLLPSVSQFLLLTLGMLFCLNKNLIRILSLRFILRPWFVEVELLPNTFFHRNCSLPRQYISPSSQSSPSNIRVSSLRRKRNLSSSSSGESSSDSPVRSWRQS